MASGSALGNAKQADEIWRPVASEGPSDGDRAGGPWAGGPPDGGSGATPTSEAAVRVSHAVTRYSQRKACEREITLPTARSALWRGSRVPAVPADPGTLCGGGVGVGPLMHLTWGIKEAAGLVEDGGV